MSPWPILVLGIIIGGFLGYASASLIPQEMLGYTVVATIILMIILSRIYSPKRTRKMSGDKILLLNFLSGAVFGYGMILLLLFISSG